MEYCLTTHNLTKHYGSGFALDGLNMHVEKGAIYGFVGKNGSGKTTLIRLITGLQSPSSGSFELLGTPHNDPKIGRVRRRVGAIVEVPSIYLGMTAQDNIKLQLDVLGVPDYSSVDELLSFVGLRDVRRKKAKNYSLGMRQRLAIAIALAGEPDFIVLDEPINGLDPMGIVEVRELILKLNRTKKVTVLISSHILGELSKLATHYGFIEKGRIVKEISAAELDSLCKKSYKIEVTNVAALSPILDKMGVNYKIISLTEAEIFDEVDVTDLSNALLQNDGRLLRFIEKDEDLETYFVNLVGGESNG